MSKTILIAVLSLLIVFMSSLLWAKISKTWLVLDMRNASESLPKHFRTTNDFVSPEINTEGFRELQLAGSAQFSKSALDQALKRINHKEVMVIDLRQESHGLLNGNAISWYGPHNANNAKYSPIQIENKQANLLASIANKTEITVYQILKKTSNEVVQNTKPIEFAVHSVSSEQELIEQYHLQYRRLFIQDFHAPIDDEVDQFVQLIKQVKPGTWLYFHCRAGVGRTSLFMVMTDMLRNAKAVSFEDIVARQVAIGGKDLTEMPEENHYKYKLSAARLQFLKSFYLYAQQFQDTPDLIWSEWIKN